MPNSLIFSKSAIQQFDNRPVCPTELYKGLQVIGFEGALGLEVFLV